MHDASVTQSVDTIFTITLYILQYYFKSTTCTQRYHKLQAKYNDQIAQRFYIIRSCILKLTVKINDFCDGVRRPDAQDKQYVFVCFVIRFTSVHTCLICDQSSCVHLCISSDSCLIWRLLQWVPTN